MGKLKYNIQKINYDILLIKSLYFFKFQKNWYVEIRVTYVELDNEEKEGILKTLKKSILIVNIEKNTFA